MTIQPSPADGLTRRDFVRTALAAGLAGALQPLASGEDEDGAPGCGCEPSEPHDHG